MGKIKQILKEKLKGKVPDNLLRFLPAGYFVIGKILIVEIDERLNEFEKEIGKVFLEIFPYLETVVRKTGPHEGETKKPKIKIIAGKENTETIHKENGVYFKLDVSKIEFSKGNKQERKKLISLVKKDEVIVDMFAGIGYFSIPIAVHAKPKKIYAIDINPIAIEYLKENCRLNKVSHIIVPILGDCREVANKLKNVADRIIMGYIPNTRNFLPFAFKMIKQKGVIHYHDVFHKKELWSLPERIIRKKADENGFKVKILEKRIVKSYAPRVCHVVVDFLVVRKWV